MYPLTGKTALVEGASTPVGAAVSRALADAGAVVRELDIGEGTRDGLVAQWEPHGIVDIYVHTGPWARAPRAAPLVALDDEGFAEAFERPVLALLWSLRAGYTHLARPGGRVVLVVPTAAMAGAPGLAATAAAAEAQRQLAKSVARQWGSEGLAVNIVAADLAALAPDGADLPAVSLSPPALGPDAVTDLAGIARLVSLMASGETAALTGATLSADGGIWMAP
jgi:NAD(P)-dependent dehydrogenase (short-subunit alcohol dehydrogenase family)